MPQNAWNDKLVDVSDVVETQKAQYHPTALLASQYYNNVTKKRSFYGVPFKTAVLPIHIWKLAGREGRLQDRGHAEDLGRLLRLLQGVQKKLREQGMRNVYGLGFQLTTTGRPTATTLFHHFLIAYGGQDIVTKDGKLHLDDPKVQGGGDQGADLSDHRLQGRLCAAGRDQLERRRRQQRLPRQADRHGSRRHDLDRGRDVSTKKEEYDDIVTMGLPLSNDGKPVPAQLGSRRRLDPEGREERRGRQGLPEICDPAEGA